MKTHPPRGGIPSGGSGEGGRGHTHCRPLWGHKELSGPSWGCDMNGGRPLGRRGGWGGWGGKGGYHPPLLLLQVGRLRVLEQHGFTRGEHRRGELPESLWKGASGIVWDVLGGSGGCHWGWPG